MNINKKDLIATYRKEYGGHWFGEGSFSTVIGRSNRSPKVLKINLSMDNSYHYYKWCMEEPAPWKPIIYDLQKTGRTYLCVMKRYSPITWEQYDRWTDSELCDEITEELEEWIKSRRLNLQLDLHQQNILVDARGRVIIADPVWNGKE